MKESANDAVTALSALDPFDDVSTEDQITRAREEEEKEEAKLEELKKAIHSRCSLGREVYEAQVSGG